MIELKDITKKYKNKVVLDNLSFSINRGQNIMIFGKNGCGKTTLLKIIVGQIQKYDGMLCYNNSIKISSIIETPKFFENWTGIDNLFYFLEKSEMQNVDKHIDLFGLREDINRKVSCYSLGMKQKLLLILAFSREFDLLILDEPYISLDENAMQKLDYLIVNIVKKQKSVLTVSHTINDLPDNCLLYHLENGRLTPLLNELSGFVKYNFEFTNSFYKNQALCYLSNLKIIEQTDTVITCLIGKDEIVHYIKILCEHSMIQARLLRLTEEDLRGFYNV